MLSSGKFLSQLASFPCDTINDETVELIKPYLNTEYFDAELATETCGSVVTALLTWAKAMAKYFTINKSVLPIKVGVHFEVKHNCQASWSSLFGLVTQIIVQQQMMLAMARHC